MDDRQWIAIAPLINFTFQQSESIQVFKNVQIRGLTIEEQGGSSPNSLFRFMSEHSPGAPAGLPRSWALVGEFEQPQNERVLQSQPVLDRFARIVDALHLMHDEMVNFPFVIFGRGEPPEFGFGTSGNPYPSIQAWQRASNHPYRLPETERERVKQLASTIERILSDDPNGAVSIAIGRMNATHLRSADADRIIDSSIAIEAILLKGAEDELSYRQAIRGAHLLGGSPEERRATFDLLRSSYSRRSKIVHGLSDPGVPDTNTIANLARRIVLAFVDRLVDVPHKALIEQLDGAATAGPAD